MEQQHHDEKKKSEGETSADYIPYPKINPEDIALPPPPPDQPNLEDGAKHPPPQSQSVDRSSELTREFPSTDAVPRTVLESNPYVSHSPDVSSSSSSMETIKGTAYTVRNVLSSWAKKVGEKTKAAEDLAGNVWQHLKTAPSLSEAAIGRIAHSTKVVAEGGNEKIFRQTFDTTPEEELINTYACYLSTSAGPVMGVLYLSTAKLAFCSDSPLSYKIGDNTEWSYYKVIIPLHQLKAVNPTASTVNRSEKYIQFISIDNHEFWFMGFMTYHNAVKSLQEAFQTRGSHSA